MLGIVGFGILGAITQFTSVVNKFASFRMGELVIKYVGHYHGNRRPPRAAAAVFKAAALAEMLASLGRFWPRLAAGAPGGVIWQKTPALPIGLCSTA